MDDEADITRIFRIGLERKGFELEVFNDPETALKELKPNTYDLAIFDWRMPRLTGLELYSKFKQIDSVAKIGFLTGVELEKDPDMIQVTNDPRVKIFLKKPISLADLVREISEVLPWS